jgi:hypothetical protein
MAIQGYSPSPSMLRGFMIRHTTLPYYIKNVKPGESHALNYNFASLRLRFVGERCTLFIWKKSASTKGDISKVRL